MSAELSPIDKAKFVAAKRAVAFVEPGMKVGLGTGSTAAWMVRCLAERVREESLRVVGVPTSTRTAELARKLGIPITSLDDAKWLDLTIDGADEFDLNLALIKGGGAALLQEKIVATASDQMIVIADAAKEVAQLGAFPLPVEVIPFGWQTSKALVEELLVSMDVLDRRVTLLTAVLTSWRVVLMNPLPLAFWATLIMGFTLLGLGPLLLGLVFVVPMLGHASWHAYRDLVDVSGLPPREAG